MTDRVLNIALSFDAEMDVFDTSIASPRALEWRGIEQGIPLINDILADHRDSRGRRACVTWFVRCDDQIESMTGSRAYLLEHYRHLWLEHQNRGDEIGFHPHLYCQDAGRWKQDTDPDALREQIFRAFEAMKHAGFYTTVSRIGEAFSSNAIMNALEEAGIRCDSTAMPGRVREDGDRNFNWANTPAYAYHPSEQDYRVPRKRIRPLIEVPMSMLKTRADYDQAPCMRYLDLSFHPRALQGGVPTLVANTDTIVTVTHPSAVLPGNASHGLLSFSPEAFAYNLRALLEESSRQDRPVRFVTLRDIAINKVPHEC